MNEQIAERGDWVKVHYSGINEADTVFATSTGGNPLEFIIGDGKLIPGFEKSVIGMQVGNKQSFNIPPEEAFGQRRDELVATVDKATFPESVVPEKGKVLNVKTEDGKMVEARITHISGDEVIIDANHPLAGQTIRLDVELLDVKKKT